MIVQYDPEVDALYARVRSISPDEAGGGTQLDEQRIVHYDRGGEVVGIEFLDASLGLDLVGVPFATEIAAAVRALGRLAPAA